jgi:hypothetical protein
MSYASFFCPVHSHSCYINAIPRAATPTASSSGLRVGAAPPVEVGARASSVVSAAVSSAATEEVVVLSVVVLPVEPAELEVLLRVGVGTAPVVQGCVGLAFWRASQSARSQPPTDETARQACFWRNRGYSQIDHSSPPHHTPTRRCSTTASWICSSGTGETCPSSSGCPSRRAGSTPRRCLRQCRESPYSPVLRSVLPWERLWCRSRRGRPAERGS